MKRISSEEGSRKTGKLSPQTKASAISKQVLKSNPIPQQLINRTLDATNLVKPKAHPLRSSKVSQKLVIFPQSSTESQDIFSTLQQDHDAFPSTTSSLDASQLHTTDGGIQSGYVNEDNNEQQQASTTNDTDLWQPHHHAAQVTLPMEWTFGSRTDAERMPKDERDFAQLPRVAAYCTAEGYNLTRLRPFLCDHHHVSPRQYDEALYAAYHFPLMTLRPDKDNRKNRIQSSSSTRRQRPPPPSPQQFIGTEQFDAITTDNNHSPHQQPSKRVSERHQLERAAIAQQRRENEESDMNYDEDHMDQEGGPVIVGSISPRFGDPFPIYQQQYQPQLETSETVLDNGPHISEQQQEIPGQSSSSSSSAAAASKQQETHTDTNVESSNGNQQQSMEERLLDENDTREEGQDDYTTTQQQQQQVIDQKPGRKPFTGGEVFVFDYGVVVFWNFCRAEELLMLEDFADYSIGPFRDNPDEDLQIEEMHFQYDTSQWKPRIFNDMITMKTGNHMIKLTLSHGLSQSAVLARYEDIMDKTIEDTKYLPKEMAETGRLGKTRAEITTINGRLFNLRMNVNLVSNVLDTPEIFWSEPALQPMYNAIREYLEIPQRAKILNDRLRVISDLLSMLRDHLTNFGVEYQTLIIIYLIIIAVIVACFEIAVKILQSIKL